MRNLLFVIVLALTFYSCNKDSDSPVIPEPNNTIFTQAGVIDSFRVSTVGGNRTQTANFFSAPYDFTGLDSITVQFTYWKAGSSATPVAIVYIESSTPNTLYGQTDTLHSLHFNTITKRIQSPKKIVTLGYTIKAERTFADSSDAIVKLSDVSIFRK